MISFSSLSDAYSSYQLQLDSSIWPLVFKSVNSCKRFCFCSRNSVIAWLRSTSPMLILSTSIAESRVEIFFRASEILRYRAAFLSMKEHTFSKGYSLSKESQSLIWPSNLSNSAFTSAWSCLNPSSWARQFTNSVTLQPISVCLLSSGVFLYSIRSSTDLQQAQYLVSVESRFSARSLSSFPLNLILARTLQSPRFCLLVFNFCRACSTSAFYSRTLLNSAVPLIFSSNKSSSIVSPSLVSGF